MLTGLITNGEGYCYQPNREGCSGSLVFVHGLEPITIPKTCNYSQ